MRKKNLYNLLERAARERGIPEAILNEIVDLAHSRLRPTWPTQRSREREATRAVAAAQQEWSGRLWSAMEAMSAQTMGAQAFAS